MIKWGKKLGSVLAYALAFCALAPLTARANYIVQMDRKYVDGTLVMLDATQVKTTIIVSGGSATFTAASDTGRAVTKWQLYRGDITQPYKEYSGGTAVTLTYDKNCESYPVCYLAPCYTTYQYTLITNGVSNTYGYFTEVSLDAPTDDGRTFNGWTATGGGTTKTISKTTTKVTGADLGVTADGQKITLTEKWSDNVYTVTIDPGEGGSGGSTKNYTYSDTSDWTWKFQTPTRTGCHIDHWTIEGWNNKDKNEPTISEASPSGYWVLSIDAKTYGNITAMPTWEANTVNIHYRNVTETELGAYCPKTATYDESFKVSMPTRAGYTFTGWQVTQGLDPNTAKFSLDKGTTWLNLTNDAMKVGAACDPTHFKNLMSKESSGKSDGDIILYANWSAIITYKVDVVASPEEGGIVTITDTHGIVTNSGDYSSGEEIKLNATANAGYTFVKWEDDPTAKAERSSLFVTNRATYTANFKGNQYSVLFLDSACDKFYQRSVTYGQPYGDALPTPDARVGWVFAGWFDDGPGGTGEQIASNTIVRVTVDNKFFYSRWKIAPPNYVAFDGNGATNTTMAVQMFTNGVAQALSKNTYATNGVAFAGWGTNSVSEVVYTDGQTITLTLPANTTNTLWAVWTNNIYKVSLAPGSHVIGDDQTLCKTNGTPLVLPGETYKRGGYTQTGWSYDEGGLTNDYPFGSNYVANASVTLYPYWSAQKHTITICPGYEGGTTTFKTYATSSTSEKVPFDPPSRDGYTLKSWQTSPATVGKPTVSDSTINIPAGTYGDFTITAQWTGCNHTITVTTDDKQAATKTTVDYQVAETNQNVYFTLPTQTGKSISSWTVGTGWKGTKPTVVDNHVTISANTYGDFAITATLTNNVYMVTIAPGEGGSGGSAKTYTYDTTQDTTMYFYVQDFPTRAGYHIGDWCLTGGSDCDYLATSSKLTVWVNMGCHGDITATPSWVADPNPPPGEADRRDISAVSFTDGTLKMTFTNADERFDYLLRGTNTLENAPRPWPTLWTTNGTGTIVIEPPKTSETQMFYYLETSQRK